MMYAGEHPLLRRRVPERMLSFPLVFDRRRPDVLAMGMKRGPHGSPLRGPLGRPTASANCCCSKPQSHKCENCTKDKDIVTAAFSGVQSETGLGCIVVGFDNDCYAHEIVSGNVNGRYSLSRNAASLCSWSAPGPTFVGRCYDLLNADCSPPYTEFTIPFYVEYDAGFGYQSLVVWSQSPPMAFAGEWKGFQRILNMTTPTDCTSRTFANSLTFFSFSSTGGNVGRNGIGVIS